MSLKSGFHFVDLSTANQKTDLAAATAATNDGVVVRGYAVNGVMYGFVWDAKGGGDPIVSIG